MNTDWKTIAKNLAEALKNAGAGAERALEEFHAANAPHVHPVITVSPGRYLFGGDRREGSVGVVLAVREGKAYGYHECDGNAYGAIQWSEGGLFADGEHTGMNLVERLPHIGPPKAA